MFINDPPAPQDRTLVLLSGGMDSATALAIAIDNTCARVYTLSFDYGQNHILELDSVRNITKHYELKPHFHSVSLAKLKSPGSSGWAPHTSPHYPLIAPTWKPGRNIIMLALAGAYAWQYGCTVIVGGWHQEDYPGYPDCRIEFLIAMESALYHGLAHPVRLWAPLLFMNKTTILKVGLDYKVPFELTWSCYHPEKGKPCEKCDACLRRARAFKNVGIRDPATQVPV